VDMLVSWAPMILLIGVWVFIMRKYAGKNSPQRLSLALMDRQVAALERIAKSLSSEP